MDCKIELKALSKSFNRKLAISNINHIINQGISCVVTGPNGSGKSTLLKIICGLLRPSTGQVLVIKNHNIIPSNILFSHIGFISSELNIYTRLTTYENLVLFARLKEVQNWKKRITELLDFFQLEDYTSQQVTFLSSGIKQRLKLACALVHNPLFLILDEPGAGLDHAGKMMINEVLEQQLKIGLAVIATNDEEEVKKYGSEIIRLNPYCRPGG